MVLQMPEKSKKIYLVVAVLAAIGVIAAIFYQISKNESPQPDQNDIKTLVKSIQRPEPEPLSKAEALAGVSGFASPGKVKK